MLEDLLRWGSTALGFVFVAIIGALLKKNADEFAVAHKLDQLLVKGWARMRNMRFNGVAWWLWLALGVCVGSSSSLWLAYGLPGNAPLHSMLQSATPADAGKSEARPQLNYGMAFAMAGDMKGSVTGEEHPFFISSPDENKYLQSVLWTVIRQGIPSANWVSVPKDDLDSPKTTFTNKSGIVIHGSNIFAASLIRALSQCFEIYKTASGLDSINEYFSKFGKRDLVWIEIGPGSPWKSDGACELK